LTYTTNEQSDQSIPRSVNKGTIGSVQRFDIFKTKIINPKQSEFYFPRCVTRLVYCFQITHVKLCLLATHSMIWWMCPLTWWMRVPKRSIIIYGEICNNVLIIVISIMLARIKRNSNFLRVLFQ
jgi:hypothetical protein